MEGAGEGLLQCRQQVLCRQSETCLWVDEAAAVGAPEHHLTIKMS
jgi:hypothetical protein